MSSRRQSAKRSEIVKLGRRWSRVLRVLLSVVLLGVMLFVLKGREQDFSVWGGLAMAAVFIGIGVVLDLVVGRRSGTTD
jgi:hypothetical protein